ncbi:nucleic acid-binding protein [Hypoxylon sp. NC1633]|nr:nucleic acid-binding protein [Hypoxylon sp. NC1633]
MGSEVAAALANVARGATKEMHGVVVSAGRMDKTVKVRLGGQRWEPKVQKFFKEPRFRLVHDPANSVCQGDVVAITPSWRVSQHVRHVVKYIIAPYGDAIDQRPPIPTLEERIAEKVAKRAAKDERKKQNAALRKAEAMAKAEEKAAREEERARRASGKTAQLTQPPQATTLDDVD